MAEVEIEFRFKPLVTWAGKSTRDRRRSPFSVTLARSYALLRRELKHLAAKSPVTIQVQMTDRDIRLDGLPRSDARRPSFPGVTVSFEAPIGGRTAQLNFACDAFLEWEDHVRAITLTLEHLRGADRYGVTKSGEQYRGWAALPGAGKALVTAPRMTVDEAARVLAEGLDVTPGHLIDNPDATRLAYRDKAMRAHPDRGGDAGVWAKIQDAKDTLDRHHAAGA